MKQRAMILTVLATVSMGAHASDYARVLNKAELMERSLQPKQTMRLAQATTGEMKQAMNACSERVGDMHGGLGVVFRIDGKGQVTKTWTRNGTAYELCFAETMAERIEYDPPMEPFFTSIDFGRAQ